MVGSRNSLWLGGRHPALPSLKRSLRRCLSRRKIPGASRTNPPHAAWAIQGDPNLGVAPNATSDKRGHRWICKVDDAMANKVVAGPLRPKLRHCLLAAKRHTRDRTMIACGLRQ